MLGTAPGNIFTLVLLFTRAGRLQVLQIKISFVPVDGVFAHLHTNTGRRVTAVVQGAI